MDGRNSTLWSTASGGSLYEPRALVQEELHTILFDERTPVTWQWLTQRCGLHPDAAAAELASFAAAYPREVLATWHCEGVGRASGAPVAFLSDGREQGLAQLLDSAPRRALCYGLTPAASSPPPPPPAHHAPSPGAAHDASSDMSMDSARSSGDRGGAARRKRPRGRRESSDAGAAALPPQWAAPALIAAQLELWWAHGGDDPLNVPAALMRAEHTALREVVHMWCDARHAGAIDHATVQAPDGAPLSLTLARTASGAAPLRRLHRSAPPPAEEAGMAVDDLAARLRGATLTARCCIGAAPAPRVAAVAAGWGAPGEVCEE